MKIIPAIDLKDGKCVRLLRGEFDKETIYSDDPTAVAERFSRLGCSDLHIVDLDGARSGRQPNRKFVEGIRTATDFTIQVGGGVRDSSAARYWIDAGIDRLVIGSAAVTNKQEVRQWFDIFGAERIVLALDTRIDSAGNPFLATHGWTMASDQTLWQCIDGYLEHGLNHVLCTDIGRDGAMSGPNIALYEEFSLAGFRWRPKH
jgi:phosphoribosylformimino-5-aminoimidazole carboxamide ribotide isomerase